jgi:hypothetical protein
MYWSTTLSCHCPRRSLLQTLPCVLLLSILLQTCRLYAQMSYIVYLHTDDSKTAKHAVEARSALDFTSLKRADDTLFNSSHNRLLCSQQGGVLHISLTSPEGRANRSIPDLNWSNSSSTDRLYRSRTGPAQKGLNT